MDDFPDRYLGNSELNSQFVLTDIAFCVAITDYFRIVGAEFGDNDSSAFRYHVVSVVGLGSQEEMVDGHAESDIASMKNVEAIGDRPAMEFPGKTVGGDCSGRPVPLYAKFSVAASTLSAGPKDTAVFIRMADVPKESCHQGSGDILAWHADLSERFVVLVARSLTTIGSPLFYLVSGTTTMSKGLLFWIIWVLCVLSFAGVYLWGWPTIASSGVMLLLFGLLGWHCFGAVVQ